MFNGYKQHDLKHSPTPPQTQLKVKEIWLTSKTCHLASTASLSSLCTLEAPLMHQWLSWRKKLQRAP